MPGLPQDPFGPAALRQLVAAMRTAFPGIRAVIEDVVAQDDKVVVRASLHVIAPEEVLGISPQAPMTEWARIEIFRVFQGRIVEQWADRDDAGLLQQIGIPMLPVARGRSATGTV